MSFDAITVRAIDLEEHLMQLYDKLEALAEDQAPLGAQAIDVTKYIEFLVRTSHKKTEDILTEIISENERRIKANDK